MLSQELAAAAAAAARPMAHAPEEAHCCSWPTLEAEGAVRNLSAYVAGKLVLVVPAERMHAEKAEVVAKTSFRAEAGYSSLTPSLGHGKGQQQRQAVGGVLQTVDRTRFLHFNYDEHDVFYFNCDEQCVCPSKGAHLRNPSYGSRERIP